MALLVKAVMEVCTIVNCLLSAGDDTTCTRLATTPPRAFTDSGSSVSCWGVEAAAGSTGDCCATGAAAAAPSLLAAPQCCGRMQQKTRASPVAVESGPMSVASIVALNEGDQEVNKIRDMYKERRDVLCDGLNKIGWEVEKPKATMFVWAKIPDKFKMKSIEFSKLLLNECDVAVSPGIGFGQYGDSYVRFSLIENRQRINQAVKGIKKIF